MTDSQTTENPVELIPGATEAACPPQAERRASERAFSVSMIVSGVRCTLTYVVLPFVLPIVGIAPGVGPALGLTLGSVAIVANVVSMRRFWRARHPWRRPVSVIHVAVIGLLLVMMTNDLSELLAG